MATVDMIRDVLDTWDDEEVRYAWNKRCDNYRYSEQVYCMSDPNDIFAEVSFAEGLEMFDHIDKDEEYFSFDDARGKYNTLGDIWEVVDLDELATYIYDEQEAFGDDRIEEILEDDEDLNTLNPENNI